jgi:hypothetical protein
MLAITLVVSCLFAFGFYAYVLVQLRREQKRGDALRKRVPEHLYEMDHDPRREGVPHMKQPEPVGPSADATSLSRSKDALRRETMLCLGLTGVGLAALIAGIEIFNSLAIRLHGN